MIVTHFIRLVCKQIKYDHVSALQTAGRYTNVSYQNICSMRTMFIQEVIGGFSWCSCGRRICWGSVCTLDREGGVGRGRGEGTGRANTEVDNAVGPACCQTLTEEGAFKALLCLVSGDSQTTQVIDLRRFLSHICFTHSWWQQGFSQLPLGVQNQGTSSAQIGWEHGVGVGRANVLSS